MKIATYNIHGGIGRDGRRSPQRIVAVMEELDADIIALQEVESSAQPDYDMLGYIAKATGMTVVTGPTLARRDGHYGNALLSRHRILQQRTIDISVALHEPRGAIDITVPWEGQALRVIATHLGLWPGERRAQVKHLLGLLDSKPHGPVILLGDLNEWFLWGRPLRWLHAHFKETPAPRTFPARRPLFALDRLWVYPRDALQSLVAHDSTLARQASDHLPLLARITAAGLS